MTTTQFNQVENTFAIKGGISALEDEFNALISSMNLDQFLASFGGREDLMGMYVESVTRNNNLTPTSVTTTPVF